jgi:hypothetical protein
MPILCIAMEFGGCAGPTTPPSLVAPTPRPAPVGVTTPDQLGNFNFDEDHPVIPDRIKALNGTTIRVRGFMVPMDSSENISRFVLVKNLDHPDPYPGDPIQQTIVVTCPPGKSVKFTADEIVVEGKLVVGIVREDDFIIQVLAVETTSVKAVKK